MQDNWYETAVSVSAPHKIISVVDWASDASIPIPEHRTPATYNVFTWGINDPAVGNRSINKENFDTLASPVGWHTLPYRNDPASQGIKTSEFYRHVHGTWGNNVRDWMIQMFQT
jgi:extracellular elastinolytic metalloproteinase